MTREAWLVQGTQNCFTYGHFTVAFQQINEIYYYSIIMESGPILIGGRAILKK